MSGQFKFGGGGGMQKSGYEGSQSFCLSCGGALVLTGLDGLEGLPLVDVPEAVKRFLSFIHHGT